MKKKIRKIVILSFIFLVGLLFKPSNALAVYNCFYMLPYSGWDYPADKPLEFENNQLDLSKNIYSEYLDTNGNNMYNNLLSLSGNLNLALYPLSTMETYDPNGDLRYPFTFHFYQGYPDPARPENMKVGLPIEFASLDAMPNYSMNEYLTTLKKATKCPQYLKLKFTFNGQPEDPNHPDQYITDIEMKETTKTEYSSFLKSTTYRDLMKYTLNETYEGDLIIPHFYYNFWDENDQLTKNEIEIVLSNFYFPESTIGTTSTDGRKRIEENQEAAKIFNDIFVTKWDATITSLFGDYKNKCGDQWDDLLSISKHANAIGVEGTDTLDEFRVAMSYLYGVGKGIFSRDSADIDLGASQECLNARDKLVDIYIKAFMPYWQSIRNINIYYGLSFRYESDNAAHEMQSFSNLTPQIKFDDDDKDTNPDAFHNFFIRNMLRYYPDFYQQASDMWSLLVIGGGVAKKDDTQSQDVVDSKRSSAELHYCTKVRDKLEKDLCILHCEPFINYEGLNTIEDAEARYKILEDCVSHDHSTCTSGLNGCNQLVVAENRNSCLESLLPENYKKTKATVLNNMNKCIIDANNNLNKILDSNVYKFAWADIAAIGWNSIIYEGDCSDVKIFRIIWQIITIGAPFLVIVFGSIDFFKNMTTNKPDERKKNNKRFIRRIIALVLLLVVPFAVKTIIRTLVASDNSANNLKLMQCIVNGEED